MARAREIQVGTSGWQYDSWRGDFYPRDVPQTDWLPYYARHFSTVEVNATFYGLPSLKTTSRWHDETPAGFEFVVKLSRYVSHARELGARSEGIGKFFDRIEPLAAKCGPLLIQLPPSRTCDIEGLDRLLRALPRRTRAAVEFRHPSWENDDVRRLLEKHGAATCWADRRSRLVTPSWQTTPWIYLRMHEGRARPAPGYGHDALKGWAQRLAGVESGYVFFNNDTNCRAPHDAENLVKNLEKAGRTGRHAA